MFEKEIKRTREKTEQMTREILLARKIRTFGHCYPKLKSLRIHDFDGFYCVVSVCEINKVANV